MKVYAIGDELFVSGMRLAGVAGRVVSTNEEMKKEITALTSTKDVGIFFLAYSFSKDIADFISEYRVEKGIPILLEVPDKELARDEDTLAKFIKSALGINI